MRFFFVFVVRPGRGSHTWRRWWERRRRRRAAMNTWRVSTDNPMTDPSTAHCVIIGCFNYHRLLLRCLAGLINRFKVRPPDRGHKQSRGNEINPSSRHATTKCRPATLSSNWALEYDDFQHTKLFLGPMSRGLNVEENFHTFFFRLDITLHAFVMVSWSFPSTSCCSVFHTTTFILSSFSSRARRSCNLRGVKRQAPSLERKETAKVF